MTKLGRPYLLGIGVIAGFASSTPVLAQTHPIEVGSIDGAPTVEVKSGSKIGARKSGAELKVGDRLITRSNMTVSVRYADGSVLVAGQGTELEVLKPKDAEYALAMEKGALRALVKTRAAAAVPPQNVVNKFRFTIRTRAAVMGVRGTDFVITADSKTETSETHVFEGRVDVAKSTEDLVEEREIVRLASGQKVEAKPEGLSEPETFDEKRFLQDLDRQQPGLGFQSKEQAKAEAKAPTEETVEEPPLPRFYWNVFRGSLKTSTLGRHQFSGPAFTWAPVLRLLGGWLRLRAQVGAFYGFHTNVELDPEKYGNNPTQETNLRDYSGNRFGLMMGLYGSLKLGPVLLELGPGAQLWSSGIGGLDDIMVGAGWQFNNAPNKLFDHMMINFGGFRNDGDYANGKYPRMGDKREFRLSIGLKI